MNSAWKKLWPEAVIPRDFEGFEDDPGSPTVEHIVSLGRSMGLEVNAEDVEELAEGHTEQSSALRSCRNFKRSSNRECLRKFLRRGGGKGGSTYCTDKRNLWKMG